MNSTTLVVVWMNLMPTGPKGPEAIPAVSAVCREVHGIDVGNSPIFTIDVLIAGLADSIRHMSAAVAKRHGWADRAVSGSLMLNLRVKLPA